ASVGSHFAQPMQLRDSTGELKRGGLQKVVDQRRVDPLRVAREWMTRFSQLPPTEHNHLALRRDYRDFLAHYNGPVSVVYADPPYTRDHYSRFYHVLETMALRDVPRLTDRIRHGRAISRGLYRENRHQSPFCIKSQAPAAFADLFSGVRRLEVPLCL